MRTQLGTYCQQFDGTLRPLLEDLSTTLQALEHAADDVPGRSLQAPLREVRHQLQTLCDKVAEQQAYVLIFGPLKSGKSTLMNAIAAAYVSEVSSLPAYPCLVFVSAGKQREYAVTAYDGSTRLFQEPRALAQHIDKAHGELATAIRTAEQRGVTFDPQEHFPQAIRRVDVRVPGSELASTGAVLVDTPGLYTRMRFGYDRMTRDFRNAAACAIFVVKSDTLFLEQVFAEFQQLLDLFSRIFLVVNVDAHKRDVSPDGKLVPSLEQSEPQAVLRAFEQLAMSAPLQQAAKEGRVRMYPVDLLHAASSVLQKAPLGDAPQGFQAFRKDLSEYLASNEYMAAFLRDSLQRAETLLGETLQHLGGKDVQRLAERLRELDEQLHWLAAEQKRMQQALTLDWSAAFARGTRELDAEVERFARDAGAKLLRTLGASIDTWFLSSHSLEWLTVGQWTPLVRDHREEVHAAARRTFDQTASQLDAGLDLPDGIPELVRRAGIDLRQLKAHALAAVGTVPWPASTSVPVDLGAMPLKKSMLDMVAFRSLERVRERLFGPVSKPDLKIPGKEKAARLGEPGRLFLHQCVAQFRAQLQPETTGVLKEHFGAKFFAAATKALVAQLAAYQPRLLQKQQELTAVRNRLIAVAEPIQSLVDATMARRPQLVELEKNFDHEVQAAPAAGKDVVLAPQAPRPRDGKSVAPSAARPRDARSAEKTG
ncbi:MAG: dynamin family protein [Planctomycetes bacterium]|nr:dynamin family protein [Planctomycetota bacterium]